MNDNAPLTQLAAEMAQLQQQIEQMNQRLDMIYGAVTRLAEAKATAPSPVDPWAKETAASQRAAGMAFSAQALLDPGSMLASLHQHAVKTGLKIPTESVERLQEGLPVGGVKDGNHSGGGGMFEQR
ncbi:MAG: hypothetical protein HS126_31570 [Anaerolineales bacterium]|nr:hypothetical protein [Anaerolineales bacterium]